jgi:hypothetical protein
MVRKHDPETERARLVAASSVSLLAVLAFLMIRVLPPQHSPFAKLDLERPIGAATPLQLAAVRHDPGACFAALAASEIEVERVPDEHERAGCGYANAVALVRTHYPYSGAVRVSCPLAAALYVWEREVVAKAAERLESPVARIEMMGTYSCRAIAGRPDRRMSEHATANAIDIEGFRLENGRVISVLDGWSGAGRDRAFLREVRDGGCKVFQVVLSPDYNAAHRNHLHLDMGDFRICS